MDNQKQRKCNSLAILTDKLKYSMLHTEKDQHEILKAKNSREHFSTW